VGLEVQGNKDVLFVCDEKACGENCSKDWFGECNHTSKIEHAKNFDRLSDDLYMEKERPSRYEKAVIFFDIAVICIVLVDIALMLWG
jgi:hypothetical protein